MNGGGVSLLPTSSCNFSVISPPIFEKNVVYNIVSNVIRKGYFMGKRQFFVAVNVPLQSREIQVATVQEGEETFLTIKMEEVIIFQIL